MLICIIKKTLKFIFVFQAIRHILHDRTKQRSDSNIHTHSHTPILVHPHPYTSTNIHVQAAMATYANTNKHIQVRLTRLMVTHGNAQHTYPHRRGHNFCNRWAEECVPNVKVSFASCCPGMPAQNI